VHDAEGRDTGLGMYLADLPTSELPAGTAARFTFYWPLDDRWEGVDYAVQIAENLG
jgi:glucoamylase